MKHPFVRNPFWTPEDPFGFAVKVWISRNTRTKNEEGEHVHTRFLGPQGRRHPGGGIWYPLPREVRECCTDITEPGYAHPWDYYKHCCTIVHIANLFDVEVKELRRHIRGVKGYALAHCIECDQFTLRDIHDYLCIECRKAA